MRTRTVLAAASLIMLSLVGRAATAQEAKTICKDGTTSTATGRGACSSHGGVASKGESPSSAAKTTKKATKASENATKAAEKSAKSETKAATKTANEKPKEVTCTDGTMSKPGQGACSGHGGIKKAAAKGKKG